jgi:hypothetical protein
MMVCLVIASIAPAQQINGVPGSPGATVTLDGNDYRRYAAVLRTAEGAEVFPHSGRLVKAD